MSNQFNNTQIYFIENFAVSRMVVKSISCVIPFLVLLDIRKFANVQ